MCSLCVCTQYTNANLNRQNRIELLRIAFDILFEFLKQNLYKKVLHIITFTSYTAQKILFKLTKVSQVNEKDNIALLEAQYNDIKNDFNKVISQTKNLFHHLILFHDALETIKK